MPGDKPNPLFLPESDVREFLTELRAVRDQFPALTRYEAAPVAMASLALLISRKDGQPITLAERREAALEFMSKGPCMCTTPESCQERYALDMGGAF